MTAPKVTMPVFRKIEPDLPECEMEELIDSAQCCNDAEWEVRFQGAMYKLCEDCKTDITWLFENAGTGG